MAKKYLFIYRSNPASMAARTPQERQMQMEKWGAWIMQAMQDGWMLSPGDALLHEGKVVTAQLVTDGPFVESKEIVAGYSIIQADSLDAATTLAKSCPGVAFGDTVEVRPLAGLT